MVTRFSWDRVRVYDHFTCLVLYENSLQNCETAVKYCEQRPTSKTRPCPLNLIELQKRASKWYRLSGADTLAAAQDLYEAGLVSYPRTETTVFNEVLAQFAYLFQEVT